MLPEWFARLGLTGWPLALCSIAAVAIVCERLVFVVRSFADRERTFRRLADALAGHRTYAKPVRDEIATMMVNDLHATYLSGIRLLRMIGTISPMLGLFGTILGIVAAFKAIAANSGPVSPHMIADGLWEAMLTTAVGLAIALPSVFMAYLFQQYASRSMNDYCARLNRLSVGYEIEAAEAQRQGPPPRRERPAA